VLGLGPSAMLTSVAVQRGGWVAGLMRPLILKLRVSPSQF